MDTRSPGDAPSADAGAVAEASRQRALLVALWSPASQDAAAIDLRCREAPVPVARGLAAYRNNAGANATRALEVAYPTVCALIGADGFGRLVREHWQQQPPTCGDLAQWGGGFGEALQAHTALAEWPYLGDCARLDWAVQQCERSADAAFDADSIARLGDTDPQRLRIEFRPGAALLCSPWPVVLIHEAHRAGAAADALDAVRDALHAGRSECAFVARSGWRGQIHRLDAATARWTASLLAGDTLAAALDQMSNGAEGHAFDIASWLGAALQEGWLKGISVDAD